ncbi:MAG TPA: amidohydrolase family protein, partial [Candidatus Polarisedimenticolia bacterium]|nr:amidohydrolase family protein [Candidatus Polarisedimenticolia bacterium]
PGGARGAAREPAAGTGHPIGRIHPERRVVDSLITDAPAFEKHRAMGFGAALTLPREGIFRGQAALINLGSGSPAANVIAARAAQVVAFESGSFGQGYPASLMGSIAAVRQTFLDARQHAVWRERYDADPAGMRRPEASASLAALAGEASGKSRVLFDAADPGNALRALDLARELELGAVLLGSGTDSLQAGLMERLVESRTPIILPLAYPDKPKVADADEALAVSLRDLERWDAAPANPARFQDAGLAFALGTCRSSSPAEFPARLRKALDRGLRPETALAALTVEPARILGLERSLGTIEPGTIANVVVWEGSASGKHGLFDEAVRPRHVFVDGVRHDVEARASKGDPDAKVDPRGTWAITFTIGEREMARTWTIAGSEGDYSGTAETQRGTVAFSSVTLKGNAMTVVLPGEGSRPSQEVTVVISGDSLEGSGEFPGGTSFTVKGTRTSGPEGSVS